jgi:alkane 1-monooxygenase
MNLLSFSIVYLIPASVVLGYFLGGGYTFLTPLFVFGVVPILDAIIGKDTKNPSPDEEMRLGADLRYRLLTWFCAPLQIIIVFWGAWVVGRGMLSPLELAGFTLSMGISSGVMGINVAHELTHRVNGRLEPALSKIMLWTVFYIHWGLEHVVGHHRNVATHEDPATARMGESFYRFLPRTVFGAFNNAWEFEAARVQKKGLPVWSRHNRMAIALAAYVALLLAVSLVSGPWALVFFIFQAVIAFSLLEAVNYIEHYGLQRERRPDGSYAPVAPVHSWNSSNWLTNRFLFNLQRHSDHHYRPGRRYQVLQHHDESPQLPTGYAGMILIALVPPLWRKVVTQAISK